MASAMSSQALFVIDVAGDPGAGASDLRSPGVIPDEELMSCALNIEVVVGKI